MKIFLILFVLSMMIFGCTAVPPYESTWESLSQHEASPEWLEDAKLGIYFHWGVYSVPAFGNEWYPRHMHIKSRKEHKHHLKTFGDPTTFGYHDFVPLFKAKNFDAQEWAELFERAGAKFAGPVAEHHDGFAMWGSEVTPWNARDMGPKQDITGELAAALRDRGMRLITTFHHARNSLWEKKPGQWSGHYNGVKKNYPSLLEDSQQAMLYGHMPRADFLTFWKAKLLEVIDKYQPDIIWFDSWLNEIPKQDQAEFAAYYLNQAAQWKKNVAIIRKQDDLPLSFTMNDHEKSREPRALPELWMTDDTLSTGSWCYTQNLKIKSFAMVLHSLIDTVSKNGVLLLNISPMADGTIPQDQRDVLLTLGDWLKKNGEAIYSTRPWSTAAEGPTAAPEGGFKNHQAFMKLKYTAQDIRYTASKDGKSVYAILMGAPKTGAAITLTAFADTKHQVSQVTLLSGQAADWELKEAGLTIKVPPVIDAPPHAMIFKIYLKG